jgi:hypothetical protein
MLLDTNVTRFFIPGRKERKVPSAAIVMRWKINHRGHRVHRDADVFFSVFSVHSVVSQIRLPLD